VRQLCLVVATTRVGEEVTELQPATFSGFPLFDKLLDDLVDVLPHGRELGSDAFDFPPHIGVIEILLDNFKFVVVISLFNGTSARYHDHLIDLFIVEQPIGNVDHNVAHADNGHAAANLESL
jgi:hypothetical protein